MSFTAQIGQLTGSASSNDATTIAQALENATAEFIQKISQINPDLLYSMANDFAVDSNNEYDIDKNSIILNFLITLFDCQSFVFSNLRLAKYRPKCNK